MSGSPRHSLNGVKDEAIEIEDRNKTSGDKQT